MGSALLAVYVLQDFLGWKWPWLVEMQRYEGYKQLSGLVLVLLFVHQWRLTVRRSRDPGRSSAEKVLNTHQRWGAVIPLFLYFHAHRWGYAYSFALVVVLFAVLGTGLLQETVACLKRPTLTAVWFAGHVALSTALVFLVGYHVYISLWYE